MFGDTIYFVQATSLRYIKVGISNNPLSRFFSLQGGSPDRLVLLGLQQGDTIKEAKLHLRFKDYRSHNEWYYPADVIIEYIDVHASSPIDYYYRLVQRGVPQHLLDKFKRQIDRL